MPTSGLDAGRVTLVDRTHRATVVADALKARYDADIASPTPVFGLAECYYGDQVKIPKTPTLCIDPAQTVRNVNSTGEASENDFSFNIILYSAGLGDVQGIQRDMDELAELIMDDLNSLGTLGDLIIFGYAVAIDFHYVVKNNRLMRANRIVWTAKTKTRLVP